MHLPPLARAWLQQRPRNSMVQVVLGMCHYVDGVTVQRLLTHGRLLWIAQNIELLFTLGNRQPSDSLLCLATYVSQFKHVKMMYTQ